MQKINNMITSSSFTSPPPSSSSSSGGQTRTTVGEGGDHHHHHQRQQQQHEQLPGFRFHPTDEELVAFYLRRKVDMKLPVTSRIIDNLIKHIDIYKFDPWDLPKAKNKAGDKECYFFCRRGRKYRNSIRPNRVTGSGFWKATGIDKPVYSLDGEGHDCIGLKKTLVYYRGCAGKGTKTDWMMQEFRLPSQNNTTTDNKSNSAQEAEVWTVCKIFKRNANVSYKKYTPGGGWRRPEHRKAGSGSKQVCIHTSSNICSNTTVVSLAESNNNSLNLKEEAACNNYISFGPPPPPLPLPLPPPPPPSSYAFPNYNNEKKPSTSISIMPMLTMSPISSIHNNNIIGNNCHYFEEIRSNDIKPLMQAPNNVIIGSWDVDPSAAAVVASSSSCCIISSSDNAMMMQQEQEQIRYENWDELRSVVGFALDHHHQSPSPHPPGPFPL